MDPGEITVDVEGVGYRVTVPLDVWDSMQEAEQRMVWVSSYVREDRFDLFGFSDRAGRTFFEEFLKLPGIGPKMAMEICTVPRSLLRTAVADEDASLLTNIKGVGKKTAEKLLLELKSLSEKKPEMFESSESVSIQSQFDKDAIEALAALGYDQRTIISALKNLPVELTTTEERVAAALRSL
jgi:Holliday junction DNA helicase RuvA